MQRTVKLGDREVTRMGLGTNRLRHTKPNVDFIRQAVAAGLQMIDTAHLYTGGESEQTIGDARPARPTDAFVATKGGFKGARPDVLREEIEQSLRSLRTESIELYYLHRVDPLIPIEESLGVIKEYCDRRKILRVGVSEVGVDQIERARKVVPIAAVQNHYNISERKYDDVVDHCAKEGIVFVPFYPLGGDAAAVDDVARKHKVTPHQVMLAWLLRRSPVMLPIPGTLSIDHLQQNLAALDIELSDSEFRSLAA